MSVNTKVNGQLVPSAGLYKVSVPIQSGDIYSFEERRIGVYADGKPLYQKTMRFTSGWSLGSWATLANLSSLNIERLVKTDGIFTRSSGGTTIQLSFNGSIFPESTNSVQYKVSVRYNNNGNLECLVLTYDDITYIDVTLQYTKTTDVAGSGIYVPSGDKAVHYSENEEVIGTWIDGSTLYRKTVNVGSLPNSTHKEIAHGITNLGIVLRMFGYAKSTTTSLILPYITVEHGSYQIALEITDTNVVIWTDYDRSAFSGYVVVEYTKTS